jgi:hypothetical protein
VDESKVFVRRGLLLAAAANGGGEGQQKGANSAVMSAVRERFIAGNVTDPGLRS